MSMYATTNPLIAPTDPNILIISDPPNAQDIWLIAGHKTADFDPQFRNQFIAKLQNPHLTDAQITELIHSAPNFSTQLSYLILLRDLMADNRCNPKIADKFLNILHTHVFERFTTMIFNEVSVGRIFFDLRANAFWQTFSRNFERCKFLLDSTMPDNALSILYKQHYSFNPLALVCLIHPLFAFLKNDKDQILPFIIQEAEALHKEVQEDPLLFQWFEIIIYQINHGFSMGHEDQMDSKYIEAPKSFTVLTEVRSIEWIQKHRLFYNYHVSFFLSLANTDKIYKLSNLITLANLLKHFKNSPIFPEFSPPIPQLMVMIMTHYFSKGAFEIACSENYHSIFILQADGQIRGESILDIVKTYFEAIDIAYSTAIETGTFQLQQLIAEDALFHENINLLPLLDKRADTTILTTTNSTLPWPKEKLVRLIEHCKRFTIPIHCITGATPELLASLNILRVSITTKTFVSHEQLKFLDNLDSSLDYKLFINAPKELPELNQDFVRCYPRLSIAILIKPGILDPNHVRKCSNLLTYIWKDKEASKILVEEYFLKIAHFPFYSPYLVDILFVVPTDTRTEMVSRLKKSGADLCKQYLTHISMHSQWPSGHENFTMLFNDLLEYGWLPPFEEPFLSHEYELNHISTLMLSHFAKNLDKFNETHYPWICNHLQVLLKRSKNSPLSDEQKESIKTVFLHTFVAKKYPLMNLKIEFFGEDAKSLVDFFLIAFRTQLDQLEPHPSLPLAIAKAIFKEKKYIDSDYLEFLEIFCSLERIKQSPESKIELLKILKSNPLLISHLFSQSYSVSKKGKVKLHYPKAARILGEAYLGSQQPATDYKHTKCCAMMLLGDDLSDDVVHSQHQSALGAELIQNVVSCPFSAISTLCADLIVVYAAGTIKQNATNPLKDTDQQEKFHLLMQNVIKILFIQPDLYQSKKIGQLLNQLPLLFKQEKMQKYLSALLIDRILIRSVLDHKRDITPLFHPITTLPALNEEAQLNLYRIWKMCVSINRSTLILPPKNYMIWVEKIFSFIAKYPHQFINHKDKISFFLLNKNYKPNDDKALSTLARIIQDLPIEISKEFFVRLAGLWPHKIESLIGRELNAKEKIWLPLSRYTVTLVQFKEVRPFVETLPPPLQGAHSHVDISCFCTLFDQLNITDPTQLNVDGKVIDRITFRGYVKQLVDNVIHNKELNGAPSDPEIRKAFYDEMHNYLKLIAFILMQHKADEYGAHLITLGQIGALCASPYNDIPALYHAIVQTHDSLLIPYWHEIPVGTLNVQRLRSIQFLADCLPKKTSEELQAKLQSLPLDGPLEQLTELQESIACAWIVPFLKRLNFSDSNHIGYISPDQLQQKCGSKDSSKMIESFSLFVGNEISKIISGQNSPIGSKLKTIAINLQRVDFASIKPILLDLLTVHIDSSQMLSKLDSIEQIVNDATKLRKPQGLETNCF